MDDKIRAVTHRGGSADRRAFLQFLIAASALPARAFARQDKPAPAQPKGIVFDPKDKAYHVYPGGRIQDALERAAKDPTHKTVLVHAGTYRPAARGQALIWFNARHDGITLEGVGEVTLTAANPAVSDPRAPSHPAVVNHVVYFGDGVSRKTTLRRFKITGAKNFTTGSGEKSPIESADVKKTAFFYTDGVEIHDNYASPCGGGVSVEHLGHMQEAVLFRNCVFRNNGTQTTGAALDLLHGSAATIENCLFIGNISNMGVDYVGLLAGAEYLPESGSGALTVFERSKATVTRSTFANNWNGVDDNGNGSSYVDSIFWNNTLKGGISTGPRYELDITEGSGVRGSFIHGDVNDLRGTIDPAANKFDPPDPRFDAEFVPVAPQYAKVGYRPAKYITV